MNPDDPNYYGQLGAAVNAYVHASRLATEITVAEADETGGLHYTATCPACGHHTTRPAPTTSITSHDAVVKEMALHGVVCDTFAVLAELFDWWTVPVPLPATDDRNARRDAYTRNLSTWLRLGVSDTRTSHDQWTTYTCTTCDGWTVSVPALTHAPDRKTGVATRLREAVNAALLDAHTTHARTGCPPAAVMYALTAP